MEKSALLMLMGLLLGMTVMAQEISGGFTNAFKKGNAEELAAFWGNEVEIVISNSSKTCDKPGARQLMTDFFSANKVAGFVVNHQGQRDQSGFMVGTLTTNTGVFRVNGYFKKSGDQYLIYQIRIDKTNE